jgi:cob(I)alamin adenosyltransferase
MGKIYTRTGDKGETSLFDGKRVLKSDLQVDAYGTIDELNSLLGVALSFVKTRIIKNELETIQNDLLEIGSSLAVSSPLPLDLLEKRPDDFENLIDKLSSKMPDLKNFILPGGGRGGASLHLARTVARRAERRVVELSQEKEVDEIAIRYLNRLSDLLFTMARFENHQSKHQEKIWRKR